MAEEVKPAATPEGTTAPVETPAAAPPAAVSDSGAKPPTTLATSDPATAPAPTAPAKFPEDWRQQMADGDEAGVKLLTRYTSPNAFLAAHRALQAKMSSGEVKAVSEFPAGGDDAAKAEWRKQNGVPETKDGYEPKVEGLVFGEADKPMLDSFREYAFGKNYTPAQFNDALGWYAAEQESIKARQAEADDKFREASRDKLYSEWGAQDFRNNLNGVKNMLATAPEGFSDRLLGARLADGRLLGDDPAALKWLAGLSRELNPGATLVPPGTADVGKSIEGRLNEIRQMTRETPDKITPAIEAEQTRLIEALAKTRSRAA